MIYVISKQKNIHQEARKYRQNFHFSCSWAKYHSDIILKRFSISLFPALNKLFSVLIYISSCVQNITNALICNINREIWSGFKLFFYFNCHSNQAVVNIRSITVMYILSITHLILSKSTFILKTVRTNLLGYRPIQIKLVLIPHSVDFWLL